MNKKDLVQLTNNLYLLTSLFPKKEPLRFQTRELANEILKSSISILDVNLNKPKNLVLEIEKNLEALDSFFEVAKTQNWISISEILKVQQEYSKVKENLKKFSEIKSHSETESPKDLLVVQKDIPRIIPDRPIPARQEKILEILKEKEKLQVKDLKEIFPQVSKRTFRRDFEQLTRKRLVMRVGERNDTFYQLPDELKPKLG